jgi:endonuclease/exonuclease/phosphatase family metal-dependent hydrolase
VLGFIHRALPRRAFAVALLVVVTAPAADALRIVNYNILNYPGTSATQRNPRFRTILGPLSADVVVVQEITSQAGVNSFLTNVLNTLEPGQWAAAPFIDGNDTDNALFYKPSKVTLLETLTFYPSATNLRLVAVYRLRPVGYVSNAAELRFYSCHLKASQGFEADRFAEAVGIRDHMNAMPTGTHAILMGDFNIYTSAESAYQRFLASLADNDGRLYDPLNRPGNWNNNAAFADIHTQSPCNNDCPVPSFGHATGGMDDRFDQFLPTLNMNNGNGYEVLAATYKAVGNDGLHFNNDIHDPPVIPEGQVYAEALNFVSDHLPLRVDVQLPAEVQAPAMVAFGTVIVGAPAVQQAIAISNPAVAPADDLDYTLATSGDFSAPGGSFAVDPGAPANMHVLAMSAATAGAKAGTLTISSDSADDPALGVSLSGTVLRHAVASLSGDSQVLALQVDFGDHAPGGFSDQPLAVHNFAYDALQAQLALGSVELTGGGGRFSIVGGFDPALVGGTPQAYTLHFDDSNFNGAADSVITASLVFHSSDEPLPGAAAQPDLVVTLRAKILVATDVAAALPVTTRLYAPFPNPPQQTGTTLRFDLAQAGDVQLDVFDVAGRRVARLAAAAFGRGTHAVRWDGRGDGGRPLGSGVYFVRLSAPDLSPQTVRVTLLR